MLWVGMGICVTLWPQLVLKRGEAGLSNYGLHARTIIPYYLAFAACVYGSALAAARVMPIDRRARELRRLLELFALAMALVALTSIDYQVNGAIDDLHLVIATLAEVFELVAAVLLVYAVPRNSVMWLAFTVQLVGLLLALLTNMKVVHLLFVAEVIAGIGFGVVLTAACATLSRSRVATRS